MTKTMQIKSIEILRNKKFKLEFGISSDYIELYSLCNYLYGDTATAKNTFLNIKLKQ